MCVAIFLLWTLMLYIVHVGVHKIKFLGLCHANHHAFVNGNLKKGSVNTWAWGNLLLLNDNFKGTVDLWTTEVIPTVLFCAGTGHWWVLVFYYVWAALVQEAIEHNPKFDTPLILSGRKHLLHHKDATTNFGLFFPVWDKMFNTYAK